MLKTSGLAYLSTYLSKTQEFCFKISTTTWGALREHSYYFCSLVTAVCWRFPTLQHRHLLSILRYCSFSPWRNVVVVQMVVVVFSGFLNTVKMAPSRLMPVILSILPATVILLCTDLACGNTGRRVGWHLLVYHIIGQFDTFLRFFVKARHWSDCASST